MPVIRHIAILLLVSLLTKECVLAQRINFGLYAADGISLMAGTTGDIDFNSKQNVILAGYSVTVNLIDDATAVIVITGRTDLDVTVSIDAPPSLDLDASNTIPLKLRYAYSNLGAVSETVAKTQAVQIPEGFTSATFPIVRRTSGPPGPPPTPDHEGYTQPTGTAYLFIYGDLGPVPLSAAVGLYTGNLNITIEYATN